MKYKLDDNTKQIPIKRLKFYREKRNFSHLPWNAAETGEPAYHGTARHL